MPAVSDPGARLVEAAREAGASVEVLPGPSAVTAAMAAAGVEATGFLFGGFLPARPVAARTAALERLLVAAGATGLPLVLFEAPHRVGTLLGGLERLVPDGPRGRLSRADQAARGGAGRPPAEVRARLPEPRGELTLVVSRIPVPEGGAASFDASALVAAATRSGLPPRAIVELLRAAGMPRRAAYRAVPTAPQGAGSLSLGLPPFNSKTARPGPPLSFFLPPPRPGGGLRPAAPRPGGGAGAPARRAPAGNRTTPPGRPAGGGPPLGGGNGGSPWDTEGPGHRGPAVGGTDTRAGRRQRLRLGQDHHHRDHHHVVHVGGLRVKDTTVPSTRRPLRAWRHPVVPHRARAGSLHSGFVTLRPRGPAEAGPGLQAELPDHDLRDQAL